MVLLRNPSQETAEINEGVDVMAADEVAKDVDLEMVAAEQQEELVKKN